MGEASKRTIAAEKTMDSFISGLRHLSFREVFEVPFVLVADSLHEFRIQHQSGLFFDGPRFRVGFRIIDRDLNIDVAEIPPPEPLDQMECFRRRRAQLIHPHLSVKASRVHNERVTVPFTGGITEPRWRRVLSQLPAVEVNLPPKTEGLMNNDDVVAHLNNLPWPGRCRNSRHTLRQAVRGRLFSRKGSRFALLE